jgi:hypothetical protein
MAKLQILTTMIVSMHLLLREMDKTISLTVFPKPKCCRGVQTRIYTRIQDVGAVFLATQRIRAPLAHTDEPPSRG